jgi:hypothetical protein
MDKQKIDKSNFIQKKKLNDKFKPYKPKIKKNQRKDNELSNKLEEFRNNQTNKVLNIEL